MNFKKNKENYIYQNNDNGTILAKGKMLTLDTRVSQINNNIILAGASGRGKTRHFIKPNIMQMNCNYIISDPKGTLVLELGNLLEQNGYKIKVLNLVDMKHSNTYNPFQYIETDIDIYSLIDYLMLNIYPNGGHKSDLFWDNASKALLSAICFLVFKEFPVEKRNFSMVLDLLLSHVVKDEDNDFESDLDLLFNSLENRNPKSIAVKQYKIFKSSSGRTATSILVVTNVLLQYFNLNEYRNLTSTDNINLRNISNEKTALFVITSDTDPSKNWLAGVFYTQLLDILCKQENKYHIRFVLDDFCCTGRIPFFDDVDCQGKLTTFFI